MGKVILIKPELARSSLHGKPVKRGGVWHLWVSPGPGQRPRGHPPLARGPRGKALLAVNQVWVQHPDYTLWVIRDIKKDGTSHPSYPHRVVLAAYYRGRYLRELSEATLRQSMSVWEDEIESRKELILKLHRAAHFDPESPWRGQETATQSACSFFDIDEYGNRVE